MNDVLTFSILLNYNVVKKEWKVIVKCNQTHVQSDYKIDESKALEHLQSALLDESYVEFGNVYYTLIRNFNFIIIYRYCKKVFEFCENYLLELRQNFAAAYLNYYEKEENQSEVER